MAAERVRLDDAVVHVSAELTSRRDFVGLIGELARAADVAWPVSESLNWRLDPTRSDDSGTIGKSRASGRKRESR